MNLNSTIADALWAFGILVVNFAILFLAIFIYAAIIRPGETEAFYEAAAPGIASWTAPIGGGVIFFLATIIRAKRNVARDAVNIAMMTWAIYVIIDIAVGFLMAPSAAPISLQLMISLGIALVGGLVGAQWSKR